MAAFLYPGVKSLQLVLDRPYDTIRTTDVRDDLVAIKVWYSLTSGFNPNNAEGTSVPSGNSLNVTIPNLTPNTRYYVKYAFVSAIDEDEVDPAGPTGPGSYTVSAQLTAVVLEENISVYGYLTNDPVPIVTETDGTGGDFSTATGVFKVFNLSTEVTGGINIPPFGTGPVYAIKPFTNDNITGATINAATGVYSCTGLTDDGGNVTFTATYNGITVEQVWNVYRALAGETAPLIQLSTPNKEFIYKDQFATSSQTPSTTITARLVNLTGTPTFTVQAFTREGVSLGNIAFTQSTNTITITKAQFDALGITIGTAVVTATIGTVSDVITLFRINDGTEQITVYLSNESHGIPAYADGTTTPSSYVGSGTLIQVKQGNTYLLVDNSSPYDNGTWTVSTITANGIVCDTTPAVGGNFIEYDRHASMDNALDVATIDYTITGKTTTGVAFSIVKRQSFAKSKEGVQGATARSVAITAPNQIFITNKNTTTPLPGSIVLTAVQSNFITPTYTWLVDGQAPSAGIGSVGVGGSTFTLNSFAAVGSKTVRVTVTETIGTETFSVFDIFSVYSLREGDDAFIGGLSNENQTISYDSAGDANSNQFPITSQFFAALGITFLSETSAPGVPAVTFAKVSYNGGGTCTINTALNTPNPGPAGFIRIDAPLSVDSATAVFSATIYSGTANAKTVTKELSLNKSKDGKIGEGITQIYIRSASQPATPAASAGIPGPSPQWYATVAEATGSDPLWTSFGKRLVGATIYTWQTPVRVEGTTVINPPLKNATGYLYYNPPVPDPNQPGTPQATGYTFATGAFSSLTQYWSTTFTVVDNPTGKMWAARYSVQETVSGGAQTVEISAPFTHQNFNGLVTFTNVNAQVAATSTITSLTTTVGTKVDAAGATTAANTAIAGSTLIAGKVAKTDIFTTNTTTIDGGKITTGTINANRLNIGYNTNVNVNSNRIVIDGVNNNIRVYSGGTTPRVIIGNLTEPAGGWPGAFTSTS